MSASDFLVELGTEELPPLALPELERAFAAGVLQGLKDAALPHGALRSFATPRRLAVLVTGLAAQQPAQAVKLKGPPVNAAFDKAGNPTMAATKFAEKCGVDVSALARVTEGKGEFLFYAGEKAGVATLSLLPAIVQKSLDALPIPKRMRWGSSAAEFVRPVHWLVMLFGGQLVPARILDTDASVSTRGHRFMAPREFPLAQGADYEPTLRTQGNVIADFAERRATIREQVVEVGRKLGGQTLLDDALLDEVTALVEWPRAIAGDFEPRFLDLPREVLISTLQQHQRYFPVTDSGGKLLPHFITVSNIESRDPAKVRAGNERVVRPRLSDAAFFWGQDRKQPLAARLAGLDAVTFQAKLGSIGDKVRRVKTLAGEIALLIDADRVKAERAADLAKCDLLSSMVGEFPELQGTMGRYYATADGEDAEVATAIQEHYMPRGAADELPNSRVGMSVALADKIDTIAGIFSIGQKPSGSKDPFALRRAAIGAIRILVEREIDLDLQATIQRAYQLQPLSDPTASEAVWEFVVERMRSYFVDQSRLQQNWSFTTEMFEAVNQSYNKPVSPSDFARRLTSLCGFLERAEASSLTSANKRIANILKRSFSDDPTNNSRWALFATMPTTRSPDPSLFSENAEIALHQSLENLAPRLTETLDSKDYDLSFAYLTTLRTEVDHFFDQVMVNVDDPAIRENRIALLARLRLAFAQVADLSCLPG